MKNKMKIIIITMVAIVAVMIVCLVTGIIKIPGLFISNDDENDLSKIKKVMETTRPTEVFILGEDIKFSEDISVQTIDKFSEEEITYAEELINTNGYYVIYLGEKYATTWDDTRNAIADEPTGNLDKKSGENVLELLKQISKKKLVIVVSHDREAAYKYGDKVVSMSDGKIIDVEDGEQDNLSYSFEISRNGSVVNDFQNLDIHKAMEVVEKIFKNTSNQDELLLRNITKAKANSINHEELTDKNIEKSKSEVYKLSVNYKLKLAFLFIR